MPDYAQDYRVRAALARSIRDYPTAEWCDEQADHHERLDTECEWIDSPAFEQRIRASIARLEARHG